MYSKVTNQDEIEKQTDWRNNLQLLKDRGVKIIVGTDSSLSGTYAGASYF